MIIATKRSRMQKSRLRQMSDINVTPMIDVMLVLLVVFMVTAPFLTIGVKVNLPSAKAPSIQGNDTPIVVHIDKDGRVFIGDIEVSRNTLADKLLAVTSENTKEAKVFVRGDQSLSYGHIMEIMGLISGAGFKKVVLVTELPKNQEQNTNASKKKR